MDRLRATTPDRRRPGGGDRRRRRTARPAARPPEPPRPPTRSARSPGGRPASRAKPRPPGATSSPAEARRGSRSRRPTRRPGPKPDASGARVLLGRLSASEDRARQDLRKIVERRGRPTGSPPTSPRRGSPRLGSSTRWSRDRYVQQVTTEPRVPAAEAATTAPGRTPELDDIYTLYRAGAARRLLRGGPRPAHGRAAPPGRPRDRMVKKPGEAAGFALVGLASPPATSGPTRPPRAITPTASGCSPPPASAPRGSHCIGSWPEPIERT